MMGRPCYLLLVEDTRRLARRRFDCSAGTIALS